MITMLGLDFKQNVERGSNNTKSSLLIARQEPDWNNTQLRVIRGKEYKYSRSKLPINLVLKNYM